MAGPKGNKHAVKLTDEEIKKDAYRDYCEYLASGRSKEGWRYKDKDRLLCTYKTMENYIKNEPHVFPPINKELAECESFKVWEERGMKMMDGKANSEPALYQMFMRNKFGWDKKEEKDSVYRHDTDMDKMINRWENSGSKPETARQPQPLERQD